MSGQLLAVYPDGTFRDIENGYESIKAAMSGAIIDLVGLPNDACFFVDDNGMIERLPLNVPASTFAGMCLYGPVVLAGGADDEGETQPPPSQMANGLRAMANMWHNVVADADRKHQMIFTRADPDLLPPAEIIEMTNEQFDAYLRGEWPR